MMTNLRILREKQKDLSGENIVLRPPLAEDLFGLDFVNPQNVYESFVILTYRLGLLPMDKIRKMGLQDFNVVIGRIIKMMSKIK